MLMPGTILQSRYHVVRWIGGGGMGEVYLAEDARLTGRQCAIKAMSPAQLAPRERSWAISAFKQEAQMLARLSHVGLAAVTDFSSEGGNWVAWTMNTDGSHLVNLTRHPAMDSFPAWSLDGRRIAFHTYRDGNAEIYVMDADGSGLTRLTDHPADDWGPSWSPDGLRLAFTSDRDGNNEIYTMDVDDRSVFQLTSNTASDTWPVWSPSGHATPIEP